MALRTKKPGAVAAAFSIEPGHLNRSPSSRPNQGAMPDAPRLGDAVWSVSVVTQRKDKRAQQSIDENLTFCRAHLKTPWRANTPE
jgi:hypothetical protein